MNFNKALVDFNIIIEKELKIRQVSIFAGQ